LVRYARTPATSQFTRSTTPSTDDVCLATVLGVFPLDAGDTLSIGKKTFAFLTNRWFHFDDYGIAVLRSVPEPSGVLLLGLGGCAIWAVRVERGPNLSSGCSESTQQKKRLARNVGANRRGIGSGLGQRLARKSSARIAVTVAQPQGT